MSGFLVKWKMERLEMIISTIMHQNIYIKLKKDYAEKFSKSTSIEIQSQHWDKNRQLSMEGIAV